MPGRWSCSLSLWPLQRIWLLLCFKHFDKDACDFRNIFSDNTKKTSARVSATASATSRGARGVWHSCFGNISLRRDRSIRCHKAGGGLCARKGKAPHQMERYSKRNDISKSMLSDRLTAADANKDTAYSTSRAPRPPHYGSKLDSVMKKERSFSLCRSVPASHSTTLTDARNQ